jgi:D-inositol-3-phosphate glycosyltransferase
MKDWLMHRASSRLRSIVRVVPGAKQLRRRILSYRAVRRAAQATQPPPRVSSRLRSIVRVVPGARPLRRRVLSYRAGRRVAQDTQPPRVPSRLRSIVGVVPGARPLRRRVLSYWARRRAARETEPPRGAIDRPDGMTLPREAVAFNGWALAAQRTVAAVDIVLNDTKSIRATLGQRRPDVRANLREPGGAVRCGWTATIDLTQWPLGDLRVKVIATSRSGMSSVIGHRLYTLTGDGFEGHLDEPREGAEVHGDLLIVRGWATIGHQPVARIDVHLNGRRVGLARLRLVRQDVERHASGDLGPVTGFEYRGVVPSNAYDLEVALTAHASDGVAVVVPPRHIRMITRDRGVDDASVETLQAHTRSALAAVTARAPATNSGEGVRLLVFTHSLSLGGGQLYLSELLRQLRPTLDRCIVVSPADGILRSDLEDLGVEVMLLGDAQMTNTKRYEDHVRERALIIRGSGCNVVLLNTLGQWPAGDACARTGMPFVWAIHESFELSDWISLNFGAAGLPAYVRHQMESALSAAYRLVFEARATSEMFARFVDATHRAVVPYGVDTAAIAAFARDFDRAAARRQHGIPDDGAVLLAVGILEERKSQACIVEAFAAVAAVHPGWRLILVGDHPCEYSDAIHRMIGKTAVAQRIALEPITPNIWEWYAISDLLVSASDIESLPRSMLECMAFGVPVLSTSVFGVPELVEDGVNGWLFGARDLSAFTAALHRVLSLSAADRGAAGSVARLRVQQLHSSSNYGQAYRGLFAEALASR